MAEILPAADWQIMEPIQASGVLELYIIYEVKHQEAHKGNNKIFPCTLT